MGRDLTLQGVGAKLHYDKSLKGVPLQGNGRWWLTGIRQQGGSAVNGNGNGNGSHNGHGHHHGHGHGSPVSANKKARQIGGLFY